MSKPEKDEIAGLKAKVEALRAELARYEMLLHEARAAATGVSVGDVVVSNGRRYRVSDVEPHRFGVWLKGNPERKDGTFGRSKRNLFGSWGHDR